jgi:predicted ArsR family transcriptional regulator
MGHGGMVSPPRAIPSSRHGSADAPEESSTLGSMPHSMTKHADAEVLKAAGARAGSQRRRGPKPVVRARLMAALRQSPGYTSELAARIGASDDQVLRVLRELEAQGLVRSWGFAQADSGGRLVAVHAWRLTTPLERRRGREDPKASARASATLSRMLRGRLSRVERKNELLAAEAQRDREARLSSSRADAEQRARSP